MNWRKIFDFAAKGITADCVKGLFRASEREVLLAVVPKVPKRTT